MKKLHRYDRYNSQLSGEFVRWDQMYVRILAEGTNKKKKFYQHWSLKDNIEKSRDFP